MGELSDDPNQIAGDVLMVEFDDLDEEAQAIGREWERASAWRTIDAVAWIASRDPEVMMLVRAYRSFGRRQWSPDLTEQACRSVLLGHLRDGLNRAESDLLRAIEDGVLSYLPSEQDRLSAAKVREIWPQTTDASGAQVDQGAEVDSGIVVMSTGKGISDCEAWLRRHFEDYRAAKERGEAPEWIGRDDLKRMAVNGEFCGRLSGRGFRSAWSKAVEDFPERKAAGPKSV